MKIRFFMLRKENAAYVHRLGEQLAFAFGEYIGEDAAVYEFGSVKDASATASEAFKEAHAVIFLTQPSLYAETKEVLSKALSFTLKCNTALLDRACERIGGRYGEQSKVAYTHAYVPEKAKIFSVGDGLYPGFSLESGNQTFFMLPLEAGKTEMLINGMLIPYLNSLYQLSISVDAFRKFNAEKLNDALASKGLKAAVSGTNTASFFKEYVSCVEGLSQSIVLSRQAEKRGPLAPVDYVGNLSVTAAEFSSCPYGIAISNAYYAGESADGEKTVYLSVTNEYQTSVREVRSVPGEDIPSLLTRCCADLCTFISDIIENDCGRQELIDGYQKKLKNRYKTAVIIVSVLIAAVAAFCGVYFTMHGYSIKTWLTDAKAYLLPGENIAVVDVVETIDESDPDTTVYAPETYIPTDKTPDAGPSREVTDVVTREIPQTVYTPPTEVYVPATEAPTEAPQTDPPATEEHEEPSVQEEPSENNEEEFG